jgi:hypothetical protein
MTTRKRNGRSRIDFKAINQAALPVLPALLRRWLPGGQLRSTEYVVRNPKRSDRTPGSFSINVRTGKWADFATDDKGGDVISLFAYLFDLSQLQAARELAKTLGVRHD